MKVNFENLINIKKTNSESKIFTFKITKKRNPWTTEEDNILFSLVQKYGKENWSLISIEMNKLFSKSYRNGKQCRERWHNHLNPNISKDIWLKEEDNILMNKQLEYGNKWSMISKFLPGRTDNSIKNHFYSKIRKHIRKIMKEISKESFDVCKKINFDFYTSDKIYSLIKQNKIPFIKINKEIVKNLINKNELKNYNNNHQINEDIENLNMCKKRKNQKKCFPNSSSSNLKNIKEKNIDNNFISSKRKRSENIKIDCDDLKKESVCKNCIEEKNTNIKINPVNNNFKIIDNNLQQFYSEEYFPKKKKKLTIIIDEDRKSSINDCNSFSPLPLTNDSYINLKSTTPFSYVNMKHKIIIFNEEFIK